MKNDEVIESEFEDVEPIPQATNSIVVREEQTGITPAYLQQLDFVANNIDKFMVAQEKIWHAVLKIAKEGDWVIFGSGDTESVCLTGAGAERIASRIGISFNNWREKKEEKSDEKGTYYRYWFECDASFGGRTVRAMGRASSRDLLFGKKDGKLKELSEIPEDNIRMAAFRGAMKEGVKILLGLRKIPKREFDLAKIPLKSTSRYDFKSNAPAQQAAKPETTPASAQQPSPQTQNAPTQYPEGSECHGCGAIVNGKVLDFSKSKYGKPLCMDCQKKEGK